jgi:hypothetical protein
LKATRDIPYKCELRLRDKASTTFYRTAVLL